MHYSPNLTLINLYLYIVGPLTEEQLSAHLAVLQIVCCGLGFAIRYSHSITNAFYDGAYTLVP